MASVYVSCKWLLLSYFCLSWGSSGVNLGNWLVVEGWMKPSLFDGIPNGDMLVIKTEQRFTSNL
ncbi:hypothetical protein MKX03_018958 [Papaver bracteatum]|nr:hypothetical protein MKX03_018958 [Papaver bracteatum]